MLFLSVKNVFEEGRERDREMRLFYKKLKGPPKH
jgi:hypothetical protein